PASTPLFPSRTLFRSRRGGLGGRVAPRADLVATRPRPPADDELAPRRLAVAVRAVPGELRPGPGGVPRVPGTVRGGPGAHAPPRQRRGGSSAAAACPGRDGGRPRAPGRGGVSGAEHGSESRGTRSTAPRAPAHTNTAPSA